MDVSRCGQASLLTSFVVFLLDQSSTKSREPIWYRIIRQSLVTVLLKTNLALSAKLQCRSENKKAIAKIGVSMDSFVGMNRRYTINTQYSRLHVML